MTVASLWSVLEGCGTPVGADELANHHDELKKNTTKTNSKHSKQQQQASINPWTYNYQPQKQTLSNKQNHKKKKPVVRLAVDVSIWICEALTQTALTEHHADAVAHLVFCRTLQLLTLGNHMQLIMVLEGKRRRKRDDTDTETSFIKRRSGTRFHQACHTCQRLFECMGVPVVTATAEGEALCALLNQQGIVDAVLSNDGDCLLYGAQVVYTHFSIDHLERSQVMRYEASKLYVNMNSSSDEDQEQFVKLSRHDLIAFALLTGSDVTGNGISQVGAKKALRFIAKCQRDNPLRPESAALLELQSWAQTANKTTPSFPMEADDLDDDDDSEVSQQEQDEGPTTKQQKPKKKTTTTCSSCCHPGSKRSHKTHGCAICGTEPGEECFVVSPGGRFRTHLRDKILSTCGAAFDPEAALHAYERPNDNQVPLSLLRLSSSSSFLMKPPNIQALLDSNIMVKGRSAEGNKQFIQQSLGRLLVQRQLQSQQTTTETAVAPPPQRLSLSSEQPIPKIITKRLTRNGIESFEVLWSVGATITDDDANGLNGFEFSTVEAQAVMQERYPKLVERFVHSQTKAQGDAEVQKRKAFLESFFSASTSSNENEVNQKKQQPPSNHNQHKKNEPPQKSLPQSEQDEEEDIVETLDDPLLDRSPPLKKRERHTKRRVGFSFAQQPPQVSQQRKQPHGGGDDVANLMGIIHQKQNHTKKNHHHKSQSIHKRQPTVEKDPAAKVEHNNSKGGGIPKVVVLLPEDEQEPPKKKEAKKTNLRASLRGVAGADGKNDVVGLDDVQKLLLFANNNNHNQQGSSFDASTIATMETPPSSSRSPAPSPPLQEKTQETEHLTPKKLGDKFDDLVSANNLQRGREVVITKSKTVAFNEDRNKVRDLQEEPEYLNQGPPFQQDPMGQNTIVDQEYTQPSSSSFTYFEQSRPYHHHFEEERSPDDGLVHEEAILPVLAASNPQGYYYYPEQSLMDSLEHLSLQPDPEEDLLATMDRRYRHQVQDTHTTTEPHPILCSISPRKKGILTPSNYSSPFKMHQQEDLFQLERPYSNRYYDDTPQKKEVIKDSRRHSSSDYQNFTMMEAPISPIALRSPTTALSKATTTSPCTAMKCMERRVALDRDIRNSMHDELYYHMSNNSNNLPLTAAAYRVSLSPGI